MAAFLVAEIAGEMKCYLSDPITMFKNYRDRKSVFCFPPRWEQSTFANSAHILGLRRHTLQKSRCSQTLCNQFQPWIIALFLSKGSFNKIWYILFWVAVSTNSSRSAVIITHFILASGWPPGSSKHFIISFLLVITVEVFWRRWKVLLLPLYR